MWVPPFILFYLIRLDWEKALMPALVEDECMERLDAHVRHERRWITTKWFASQYGLVMSRAEE